MKALYTAALCSSLLLGALGHAQTNQTTPVPQAPSSATPNPGAPGTPGTSPTTNTSATPAISPTVLCGLVQEPGQDATPSQTTGGSAGTGNGTSRASGTSSTGSGTGTSSTSTSGTATPGMETGTNVTPGSSATPSTSGNTTGTSAGTAGNTSTPGTTTPSTGTSAPVTGAPTSSNTTGARLTNTDTCFAEQAALSDRFEIQSSQLADAQAANARVKALATQIIQDHTTATRQLSALAPQLGLRLPTALTGPKLTELAALRTNKGDAFDRAYVNAQVTAHEQAVNLFRAYSKSGDNAQLRDHATRTLPALERHLQAARDLLTALTR